MEAVFPRENFRIFSDDFRPVPAGKHMKLIGIHRKKSKKFPVGILLPLPAISGAFLQDPVTFPLLSCRILRDPAGSSGRNLRHGNVDLNKWNEEKFVWVLQHENINLMKKNLELNKEEMELEKFNKIFSKCMVYLYDFKDCLAS
jgi:hypothetical protein